MQDNLAHVVVHNYLETFQEFLSRAGDIETLMIRRFNGDQALFWLGADKLVISSAPIENAEQLCEQWGYENTISIAPNSPSPSLSKDILNEAHLLESLLSYAGPDKEIVLIPYSTTKEFLALAETLTEEHGLKVHLPECPTPKNLWIKDYIDSKVGFRALIPDWIHARDVLPFGILSEDIDHAAQMAEWLQESGRGSVIKASKGGSGVGNLFIEHDHKILRDDIKNKLKENLFLKDDIFIVEEIITSPAMISPSLEFFVPRLETGDSPKITYLCHQHFEASGRFSGVIMSKEFENTPWYAQFKEWGLTIANELQSLGYAGHFDLDAIVDAEENLYLVEVNARRTGGTFAHEFLVFKFGEDYTERLSAFSQNKVTIDGIENLSDLNDCIGNLNYPIEGKNRGVIVTLTSTLSKGNFGYLVVAENLEEVLEIKSELFKRLEISPS